MEKERMLNPDRQATPESSSAAGARDAMLASEDAFALMQTLNAKLLASHSATSTLEEWCARRGLGGDPAVRAKRIIGLERPASLEQRERLRVGRDEPIIYRRVELACGERVLAEAENWYVPRRLNDTIRKILADSDTPFGRAVQDLDPIRETFSVEIFWRPPLQDFDASTVAGRQEFEQAIPWRLFQHRALVFGPDRQPLSEVNETYTAAVLTFGAT